MFKRNKKEIQNDITTLSSLVEFTLLDPRAITKDIHTLINVAIKNKYCAVCVNPCNVKVAKEYLEKTLGISYPIVSVAGFPLGANSIKTKVVEIKQIRKDGADEVDVVLNIAKIKEKDYSYIKNELNQIIKAAKDMLVKIIIETCYLTRDEIKQVCKMCEKAKVDFIKTSTGYGTAGASIDDVLTIKECVKGKVGIKASGGIKTREQAEEFVRAGATRIGSSRTI